MNQRYETHVYTTRCRFHLIENFLKKFHASRMLRTTRILLLCVLLTVAAILVIEAAALQEGNVKELKCLRKYFTFPWLVLIIYLLLLLIESFFVQTHPYT